LFRLQLWNLSPASQSRSPTQNVSFTCNSGGSWTALSATHGRAREIEAAGIKEVIVFHSSPKSIRSHQKNVPFTLVGDPKKTLYKEFGVQSSLGFISFKALGAAMRGVANGHFGLRLGGGPLGLPGDFLIAPTGQIKAAKYGTHAYDQWSVDELIALAKGAAGQVA
jgi:hypothetical protein